MKKLTFSVVCLCVSLYSAQTKTDTIYSLGKQGIANFRLPSQVPSGYSGCNCRKPRRVTTKTWAGINNVRVDYQIVLFDHDVGCLGIISPPPAPPPGDYDVIALIHNFGSYAETFDVTANVYDTTDAWNLIFTQTVTLTDFPPGADTSVNFGVVTFGLGMLYYIEIYTALSGDEDPTNDICSHMQLGEVIFEMDVQTPTGDNQCLGVEFDGTYFYVTGGNSSTDPNKVYALDTLGNLICEVDQPVHSTGWGWRDLCWDRIYSGSDRVDTLYASCNINVDKFGIDLINGTLDYYGAWSAPENPNRALACEGPLDWYYTANFSSFCYKFRKFGGFDYCDNIWAMYGAAYDTDTTDGGWVWWHSQDDPGTGFNLQIEQMATDPMGFTGLTFGYEPTIVDSGYAGGLCFYEGFRDADVLFALVQGNPDVIVGIFVRYDVGVAEKPKTQARSVFGFAPDMPNPTKGNTKISYTTTKQGKVSLKVYDASGRLIRTMVNANELAGSRTVYWDGKDNNHYSCSNGVYFLKLEAENKIDTHKLILIR